MRVAKRCRCFCDLLKASDTMNTKFSFKTIGNHSSVLYVGGCVSTMPARGHCRSLGRTLMQRPGAGLGAYVGGYFMRNRQLGGH